MVPSYNIFNKQINVLCKTINESTYEEVRVKSVNSFADLTRACYYVAWHLISWF